MKPITSPPQANAEVLVNEAFETLSWAEVYGKRHETTTGLTWGYYGGRWGGFSVAAGTLALSNGTNYVTVARATGAISTSTSNTAWNDSANHARVYLITAASGTVSGTTPPEDHRCGPGGVFGAFPGIVLRGTGSPEGVVVAPIGAMYQRSDGGTGSSLYVKESGTGNTGWAAK